MHHPPRALLRRQTITLEVTPAELFALVRATEAQAVRAESQGLIDYADRLFLRVGQLPEAGR